MRAVWLQYRSEPFELAFLACLCSGRGQMGFRARVDNGMSWVKSDCNTLAGWDCWTVGLLDCWTVGLTIGVLRQTWLLWPTEMNLSDKTCEPLLGNGVSL